jgi:hypothetical protein
MQPAALTILCFHDKKISFTNPPPEESNLENEGPGNWNRSSFATTWKLSAQKGTNMAEELKRCTRKVKGKVAPVL